ncbi:PREDICTED: alpha-lactalbumin [Condylura cristata]|uniref:alpha-lactalbumin n=1 Tax=Condylura cristata TaxID=143302 RepID=UPI0003343A91|nr:PREDICTED: alpha-lactalbumin [Condylura cristata]
MMSFVSLLLVGILVPATQARLLTRCELFQELKEMDGYQGVTLPEWICIIFHSSGCDTQAVVSNNGTTEYGLFQISNKFWCRDNQNLDSENLCDISCDNLVDNDLTDDMMCARKILDKEGIDHWLARKPLCSEKLEQWRCEKP